MKKTKKKKNSKFDADPDSFSRAAKKSLRWKRRESFKVWQKDLFGNTPLLNAFLQECMFDLFFSKDITPEISDGEHLADNSDVVAVAGAATLTPNPATARLVAKQARAILKKRQGSILRAPLPLPVSNPLLTRWTDWTQTSF